MLNGVVLAVVLLADLMFQLFILVVALCLAVLEEAVVVGQTHLLMLDVVVRVAQISIVLVAVLLVEVALLELLVLFYLVALVVVAVVEVDVVL
jgi:hypothetical protein